MEKPDDMLLPAALADELGITESALAKWRVKGDGPPFCKLGHKLVRYPRSGVEAWKALRLRKSTSDSGPEQRAT